MEDKTDSGRYYINQEVGRLEFQRRVFEEAKDPRNPLLERAKFIAILGSNLDEFFMVRVGGHTSVNPERLLEFALEVVNPAEILASVRKMVTDLVEEIQNYLREVLFPELHQAGIHVLDYEELDAGQKAEADAYFREIIFPVLTPLAFDTGHPFPHISNLSLNLAVSVCSKDGESNFARVKVPPTLPYMIPIKPPAGEGENEKGPRQYYLVWISQVIIANLASLFSGLEVAEAYPFHVTRNAEMEILEVQDLDLLEAMEENVKRRRFGAVVRLLVRKEMPQHILQILAENLNVDSSLIYSVRGPLVLRDLMQLYKLDRPDLKYRPFSPAIPAQFMDAPGGEAIFAAISRYCCW